MQFVCSQVRYALLHLPYTLSALTTVQPPHIHKMASMDLKNEVAQEKYGKNFEELSGKERQSVGGTIGGNSEGASKGGQARKEQMAAAHGGDASAGYAEMGHQGGSKGGEARKEQMAAEHGGDASAGYAEMGKEGGEARKEQMAAEHGGDVSAGYSEMGSKGGSA